MPRRIQARIPGLALCVFEWGRARPGVPSYLLLHATGFHARCWDRVVAAMGDAHVLAVDLRGHGRSDKRPPYDWDQFGADLTVLVQQMGLDNLVGCGHSLGGHVLVLAAAAAPHRFSRLLLLDPVILPEDFYTAGKLAAHPDPAEHPMSRRYNRFTSSEEMAARLRDKGAYTLWQPEVFEDYCRHGLQEDGRGGLQLACPPLVEAEIYLHRIDTNPYERLPAIDLPVTVVRARLPERAPPVAAGKPEKPVMNFTTSPTFPGLAARFPQGRDLYRPDLSHLIPMQAPDWVAAMLLERAGGEMAPGRSETGTP